MPELPEVETVARGLRGPLVGRTLTGVGVDWPRTIGYPDLEAFQEKIVGRQVVRIGRRGKYVVIELDQGYLLIHLKMSGRLLVPPATDPLDKHTHLYLDLDDGHRLCFHDVRKFGRAYLVDEPTQVTGHLGPEPLAGDLGLPEFRTLLARRSGRLKSLLLNQEFLAGIGNIYADESLFAARLHPLRKADTLSLEEEARLYRAFRSVLRRAVAARGTTLDDQGYIDARGRAGTYQGQIDVYGRTGLPCDSCGAIIERIVVSGRSTHYCPGCQR
jgi:formamidopyrimidine-DNA glycosylase